MISVIILTKNEAVHIERCIKNVSSFTKHIYVVDSYSNDDTVAIAKSLNVTVAQNVFKTQAQQFNWAIDTLDIVPNSWVLRLDADEYLEKPNELVELLESLEGYSGVSCRRKIVFMDKKLNFGHFGVQKVVRIFRYGKARCEERPMDEHIIVDGTIYNSSIDLVDNCKKGLDFWFTKHLGYAEREARIKKSKQQFKGLGKYATAMRLGKIFYQVIPKAVAIPLYFLYRYIILGGFWMESLVSGIYGSK